jgi:hypothetical protein
MEPHERQTLENIEKYGCSVIHVMEEGDLPPFYYSVGITKTSQAPEAIVMGLKKNLAHAVINEYNNRVRAGEKFESGKRYNGFIEGFEVQAQKVDRSFYDEYLGRNLWLYKGPNFEALQFIYPATNGIWPWDARASAWFKSRQPILVAEPAV